MNTTNQDLAQQQRADPRALRRQRARDGLQRADELRREAAREERLDERADVRRDRGAQRGIVDEHEVGDLRRRQIRISARGGARMRSAAVVLEPSAMR